MALTKEQKQGVEWATTLLNKRRSDYALRRGYYAGNQRQMISADRLEKVFRGLFKHFRLNLCASVVDALADRLQVASFSAGEDEAQDALEVWKRNRMRRRAGHVHLEAITSGDSYAVVWPNAKDEAVIYPQRATEMVVEYDPENPGEITRAAKIWREQDGSNRLTLYYPDRIEKYSTEARTYLNAEEAANALASAVMNYAPRQVEGEAWPLPNPFDRVPVFHFANNADLGEFGVSELDDAVPVQDGVNKAALDSLVNGEYMAYPQRYALNIDLKYAEDGSPINPFTAGPERVWVLNGGENTELGQFGAGDIKAMNAAVQEWALLMALVTQTPVHYFQLPSGLVSGESQKTAEQKLDSKVADRQVSFGDTWADLMAFAVQIEKGLSADGLELDTNWKDTKPRNEMEVWQIAGLQETSGVNKRQVLRERGYTEEQIDAFGIPPDPKPGEIPAGPESIRHTAQALIAGLNGTENGDGTEDGAEPAAR